VKVIVGKHAFSLPHGGKLSEEVVDLHMENMVGADGV
jgi:hypothetical protein